MKNEKDILTLVEEEIAKAASLVKRVFGDFPSDPLTFLYFIRSMGWDIPIDDQQITAAQNSSGDVVDYIENLLDGAGEGTIKYAALFIGIKDFLDKLNIQPPNGDVVGFKQEFTAIFPRQFLDYLLINYLEDSHSKIYQILSLLGIIDTGYQGPVPPYRMGYLKCNINWDRLFTLLTKPQNLPGQVFGWGTNNFESIRLLSLLQDVMAAFRIPAYYVRFDPEIENTVASLLNIEQFSLCIPLIEREESQIGFLIHPVTADNEGQNNAGLAVSPYLIGNEAHEVEIDDYFRFAIEGDLKLDKTMGLILRPGGELENALAVDMFGLGPTDTISGSMKAVLSFEEEERTILLGSPQGARFEVGRIGLGIFASLNPKEAGVELALKDASLVIAAGEADGFLRKILPSSPIQIDFGLIAGVSYQRGFYLKIDDTPGLELTLPIQANIGDILSIDSLYLSLEPKETVLRNVIALSAGAKLGPFIVSVDRIGLALNWELTEENNGNLGPVDLHMGFKSPDGLGLALDAVVVTGGGYLSYNEASQGYEGIVQIKLLEIGITGICLIATRMPDGSEGFSMLIILCVEFFPPIQLSFGFTLSGIGGLVGVNRTIAIEALRTGLRNRALDSILFPQDPIRNAPKIISDLRSIMPPGEGRFVFGPMVKIGWGTPNIITADIGIFIELPDPVRIVILGQIAAALPHSECALIALNIDVMGVLDFGKKELSIDSTLYDSRILNYTLTGDAALRLSWGDNPCFAMSLGGFHPRFTPPPGFPDLRRLTLSLGVGDYFQLDSRIYCALTTNSLQFGSETALYAKVGGITAQGNLSYDTLIYFSPFSFAVDINGHLAVRFKGHKLSAVYLSMQLSGPMPWNAKGSAGFEILWWDLSLSFHYLWGDSHEETLPAVDPLVPLKEALDRPESWGVIQPRQIPEIIKTQEQIDTGVLILHPAGSLEIRQNVLPFGIKLQKLGVSPVKDHDWFEIGAIIINSHQENYSLPLTLIEENFARGQFQDLPESERLSRPSFEKMTAGAIAGSDIIQYNGQVKAREYKYNSSLLLGKGRALAAETTAKPGAGNQAILPGGWDSNQKAVRTGVSPAKMKQTKGYVITRKRDMTLVDLGPGQPVNDGTLTRIRADQALAEYLKIHPCETGKLQIIPAYEVAV